MSFINRVSNHTEQLFYGYFVIMLFTKGLGLTDGPVYKACLAVASAAALAKILLEQHSRKEYILIAILLVLGGINYLHTGNQGALLCILLVLAMKGIILSDAFAVGAVCWGLSFFIQIATQLLDLRQRDFVIHTKFGFRNIIRWGLGYTHPNVLQIATLTLIVYIVYCMHYRTMRQLRIVVIGSAMLSVYIFIYSLSVTGMSMTVAFLFFLLYFEGNRFYGRERSFVENILLQCIFPACVAFAVMGPLVLHGRAFDLLNSAMQTRPFLSRYFMTTFGLSPFGAVYDVSSVSLTLDCSYVNLLMHGGVVLFCLMCVGYLWLIRYLLQQTPSRENSIALAITLYTAIGAVSEPFAFNTSYKNVSLLILGSCLYHTMKSQECSAVTDESSCQRAEGRMAVLLDRCLHRAYHFLIVDNSYRLRILGISLLMGVLCAGFYGQIHQAPQEIYALRVHGDDIDDYPFLYLTQEEVEDLCTDHNNWVMEYHGPEEIMIHYSHEGIGEIETVRTQISLCIGTMAAVYIIVTVIRARRKIGGDWAKHSKPFIANVVYGVHVIGSNITGRSRLKVLSIDETIRRIHEQNLSVIRFGDGEMELIRGRSLSFQEWSPQLADDLCTALRANEPGLMVAIPDIFAPHSMDKFRPSNRQYGKEHLLFCRRIYYKYCRREKEYGSAFITRLYMQMQDKTQCRRQFDEMRQLWAEKDVTIIEGARTHFGVNNDLLNEAASIERILCPPSRAYDAYAEVLEACQNIDKKRLVLLSIGPAAKPLGLALFHEGYRVIDVGNLDTEYEWYLSGAKEKTKILKQQIITEEENRQCGYTHYLSEVVKRVKC